MKYVDLRKIIMPVTLDNTDMTLSFGNKGFQTKDYVYIDSEKDIRNI